MNGRSLASDSLESMLDYEKMTHAIEVESLRSGNQDPDGENEYVFKLEIIGIAKNLPKKEEKAEEEENEQKKEESTLREVKEELGEIGEIKIKTLSLLKQDEGDEAKKSIKISGDKIREIISKVMNQYGVTEKDTGVSIRITLIEKNKKFFFFGEDNIVAIATYNPIAVFKEIGLEGDAFRINMKDDTGTIVNLSVEFIDSNHQNDDEKARKGKNG